MLARALFVCLLCTGCSPAPSATEPGIEPSATAITSAEPAPSEAAIATTTTASAAETAGPGAAVPLEVQEHTLDAKVKSVTPIAAKAGNVFPVDADPRFVLELELLGVAPGMADDPKGSALTAGSTVAFAIHSPARVFKAEGDMVGKRMHFSVTRTRTKSGVSFGALHAE